LTNPIAFINLGIIKSSCGTPAINIQRDKTYKRTAVISWKDNFGVDIVLINTRIKYIFVQNKISRKRSLRRAIRSGGR
jgi:hypothetical protein